MKRKEHEDESKKLTEPIWTERRYWDWLEATAQACAIEAGFRSGTDDAEECAREIVAVKLLQVESPVAEAGTPEGRDIVRAQALGHAKRQFAAKRVERKRLVPMVSPAELFTGQNVEPTCMDPDGDELLIEAEFLDRLLGAANGLNSRQQQLWFRYAVDGEKIVDLQEEFQANSSSLYKAVFTIRKRLRSLLDDEGMNSEEIQQYRADLARLRIRQ